MKVLVLFSGGLDSTCLLRKYIVELGADNVYALNANYGQKHLHERECARWQARKYLIPGHYFERDLKQVFNFNPNVSGLLSGSSKQITHESYADQLKHTTVVDAYVPYRNGLLLSFAAAVAYQLDCDTVAYAAHADDAIRRVNGGSAYPDCTPEFYDAQCTAIREGTAEKVTVDAPFLQLTKAQVVAEGIKAGMTQEDFDNTHSCYEGIKGGCGTCPTCRDRIAALKENGLC